MYLQCRDKPVHLTWEQWYKFANEKFREKQQSEIEKEKVLRKQQEDEEKMAIALTLDFFNGKELDLTLDSKNGVGTSSMVETLQHDKDNKVEDPTSSTNDVALRKVQFEKDMLKQTLELSQELQGIIQEVAELFIDENVVFAMWKLKTIGQHMKNSANADAVVKEVSALTQMQKSPGIIPPDRVKKELEYDEPKKNKPLFPSARKQNFSDFSDMFKSAKKRSATSPARSLVGSPKSAKKQTATTNLKSLTDTKLDIIASGIDVLKKKKSSKLAQSLWQEVTNMNRSILNPVDTGFFTLMSNFFPQLQKLQESARGPQLKTDLLDLIGSNVGYACVSFFPKYSQMSVIAEYTL